MIKKFEEYQLNTYKSISEVNHKEFINGTNNNWSFDEEFIEKNVFDFYQNEIKLIESLGFDVEIVDIIDYSEDWDPDWESREDILVETLTGKKRIVLYKDDVVPKFIVTKIDDDYFLVDNIINKRENSTGIERTYHEYYKCDQIDGLINYLKDFGND